MIYQIIISGQTHFKEFDDKRQGRPWAIVSARHGLLLPEDRVEPYDFTLQQIARPDRQDWARRVVVDLVCRLGHPDRCTILAGRHYAEPLTLELTARNVSTVERPLEGLGIGRQLQRLRQMLAAADTTNAGDAAGPTPEETGKIAQSATRSDREPQIFHNLQRPTQDTPQPVTGYRLLRCASQQRPNLDGNHNDDGKGKGHG